MNSSNAEYHKSRLITKSINQFHFKISMNDIQISAICWYSSQKKS